MAFMLSVLLFGYCWVVGFAVLGVLYRRDDLIRTVLIAPAVGILILVYCTYVLSRLGYPIGSIARPLAAVLLVVAGAALVWRRSPLPGMRGLPCLLIFALAFVGSGWPLIINGFDWMAHLNPDAGNYMLDTDRLVRQPYIGPPDAKAWLSQTDWAGRYVAYLLGGIRTGTDLLFAWVVSVSGRDEPAAYMPLIVALHVAALSAGDGADWCGASLRQAFERRAAGGHRLVQCRCLAATARPGIGAHLSGFGFRPAAQPILSVVLCPLGTICCPRSIRHGWLRP